MKTALLIGTLAFVAPVNAQVALEEDGSEICTTFHMQSVWVTADHCVEEGKDYEILGFPATVVQRLPKRDIAYLTGVTPRNTWRRSDHVPQLLERLTAYGIINLDDNSVRVAHSGNVAGRITIPAVHSWTKAPIDLLVVNGMGAYHRYSGSPVVDASGRVVGVVVGGRGDFPTATRIWTYVAELP